MSGKLARLRLALSRWLRQPFPDPRAHCPAHGRAKCPYCHRNPADCADGDGGGCGFYANTGMHWDTCPNRIRGAL